MTEGGSITVTKPSIDDAYWFRYSEKLVDAVSASAGDIAEKFRLMVVWLWSIYTVGATVGFTLAEKQLGWLSTGLIIFTSAWLIFVYWCAVWIQVPVAVSFDPRSPTQIKAAYIQGANTKKRRTKFTMWMSLVAAALVALSLALASLSPTRNSQAPNLKASLSQGPAPQQLSLTATNLNPGSEPLLATIQAQIGDKNLWKPPLELKPTDKGLIQTILPLTPVDKPVDKLTVTVSWRDNQGTAHQLTREVEAGK